MKKKVNIALTGAAGRISYALVFRIVSGEMFGLDTEIDLRLLDLPEAMRSVDGLIMELEDGAYPLLTSVTKTSEPRQAFTDIDWALLVGSKELLQINGKIFTEQGTALNYAAKRTCKVLVVGNPCNTNAYIAKESAPEIPPQNFFAMTMLDQNRACAQLALQAGVPVKTVKNMAIWGNHSSTQFPDFYHAIINGQSVTDVITDEKWLKNTFIDIVQKRGAAIIQARNSSSIGSAAQAVIDTVKKLIHPTPEGEFFSVGVCSDGSYGVEPGLIFGYPVRSDGLVWSVVKGLSHNDFAQEKIKISQEELLQEKEMALSIL
jgi:malate dehydrogenase